MATYAQQLSLAAMLFFIYSIFFFQYCDSNSQKRVHVYYYIFLLKQIRSIIVLRWMICIAFIVSSLWKKKWLVYWVCPEQSKNGKSRSYGKSWIEAYRLLYNVTNTAFMFPVFYDCVSVFFFRGKLNFKVARVRQEEFDPQSMPSVAHDRYLKSK